MGRKSFLNQIKIKNVTMTLTEIKDWIFKGSITVAAFLIMDIHRDFKTMLKDVEQLKIDVGKHEYILNQKNDKKDFAFYFTKTEAILPNHDNKVKKENEKFKS
jgi:hypothetical protein